MTSEWPATPIGALLTQVREPVSVEDDEEYRQVTVSLHGKGVRLRQVLRGRGIKTKRQYLARAGQFIYSRIDARNGAAGIVPPELDGAVVSNDFPVFQIREERVCPGFLEYLTRTPRFEELCRVPSRGVTNRRRLKEEQFLGLEVPLPSLSEQLRITSRLDHVASRFREACRIHEDLYDEYFCLLRNMTAQLGADAPKRRMKDIAPVVRRPASIKPDEEYPELGVRSFAKGTFHKPAILGAKLGNKKLYHIEPGDLVFLNVFAWEGAIAIARPEDRGRYGSHRFITCVPNSDEVCVEYMWCHFLTSAGMAAIKAASPGAAGRNRTLGIKKLDEIEVPVPSMESQMLLREVHHRIQAVWKAHEEREADLDAFLPAALDQAFRGEL